MTTQSGSYVGKIWISEVYYLYCEVSNDNHYKQWLYGILLELVMVWLTY